MPRIQEPELGQPKAGNIQFIVIRPLNSPALYLEIPISHLNTLCLHPRKYLRYLGWCIVGVDGHVARDSPQPVDDIGDEGVLESGSVYSFHTTEESNNLFEHAINMDAINPRSTPSRVSTYAQISNERREFRQALEPRDECCIMTALRDCTASHILPFAHGNTWINVIITSRPAGNENVTGLSVNDVRNGMLLSPNIHSQLESRQLAIMKTPNHVLGTNDIQDRVPRVIRPTTEYPEGQRFTLQIIEIPEEGLDRQLVVDAYNVGCDAVFSHNTPISKPSDILLHYNYGAAALKWWGHQTELLQSQAPHPPPPPPPPPPPQGEGSAPAPAPPQGRRRRQAAPTAGSSTTSGYNLRPRPGRPPTTSIAAKNHEEHSKSQSGQKEEVLDPSAADESKPWESWDEDDWMFYCMLNTKAARERQQAAQEESSSNVRAWAQEVAGSQGTGL